MQDNGQTNEPNTKHLLAESHKRMQQIIDTYVVTLKDHKGVMPTHSEAAEAMQAMELFTKLSGPELFKFSHEENLHIAVNLLSMEMETAGNREFSHEELARVLMLAMDIAAHNWFFKGYFVKEIQTELTNS